MKKTLWVIGDSTLSSFEDKYYYPRYGYGTMLDKYLDEDFEVKNIALSGRSSKSYTQEPEYKLLLDGMRSGDFLIIGFGHNDEKTELGRFTSGKGTYKDAGSFANSLYENYIKKADEAGCRVILCTPIVRRTAKGVWSDQELHITQNTGSFIGGDYAQVIRDLGADLGIAVVDMTSMTKRLYDDMGPENTIYLHAWPSDNELSVDNTHTNIWGARVNAYLCLKSIKELEIDGISENVINIDTDMPVPAKEKYLVSNEGYKPTVFDSNLKKSEYWEDADGFSGTVFGDIGEKFKTGNFILEKAEDGGIHIAVKDNCGKISAVTDGIAMYYKKVPVEKNFVLSAKLKINDYFLNDQVSFGLMVRDEVYIDRPTPDILGDYVAAAPLKLTHGADCLNCFARKSGVLTPGGKCTREYKPGDIVDLRIESTSDGYACTFGEEATVTGGFDFKLTSIDAQNVYVGMFAARNADVTFYDVKLEYK